MKSDLPERKPAAFQSLINISDLSKQLDVQPKTIYAWTHTQQIPYVKVGRLVKFDPRDIAIWIENRKKTVKEI